MERKYMAISDEQVLVIETEEEVELAVMSEWHNVHCETTMRRVYKRAIMDHGQCMVYRGGGWDLASRPHLIERMRNAKRVKDVIMEVI